MSQTHVSPCVIVFDEFHHNARERSVDEALVFATICDQNDPPVTVGGLCPYGIDWSRSVGSKFSFYMTTKGQFMPSLSLTYL